MLAVLSAQKNPSDKSQQDTLPVLRVFGTADAVRALTVVLIGAGAALHVTIVCWQRIRGSGL